MSEEVMDNVELIHNFTLKLAVSLRTGQEYLLLQYITNRVFHPYFLR